MMETRESVVEDRGSYLSYSAADYREVAVNSVPFVIDELVSSRVTLLFGKSEAGKSMMASGILAALSIGAREFLGRSVNLSGAQNVGCLCGDFEDASLYPPRIAAAGGDLRRVRIYDASSRMPFDGWDRLLRDVVGDGVKVLVIDNLSVFVPGDINQGPPCQSFFDAISRFIGEGIAVIVVAHSSEKYYQGSQQDFIGHSSVKQRPSWHCKIAKKGDKRTLELHGNGAANSTQILRMPDQSMPVYEVLADVNGNKADRDHDKHDKIRKFVLNNCQGMTGKETADKIAAEFGGKASTHRVNLSKKTYGVAISDGQWKPVFATV